jgi:outer membrane beta-barrel protein
MQMHYQLSLTGRPVVKTLLLTFAAVWLAGPGTAVAQEGGEDEVEAGTGGQRRAPAVKTLKDRIKSVQRRQFVRDGRFELRPSVGFQLNDAFVHNIMIGGSAHYFLAESMAVNLSVHYSMVQASTETLKTVRAESEVSPLTSKVQLLAAAHFEWAPIYGKFSLFSEWVAHFDFGLTAGIGVAMTKDAGGLVPDAQGKTGLYPAFGIGGGGRLVLAEWLTFSANVMDYLFVAKYGPEYVSSSRGAGESVSQIRQAVMLNLGVSFFLPTSNPTETL